MFTFALREVSSDWLFKGGKFEEAILRERKFRERECVSRKGESAEEISANCVLSVIFCVCVCGHLKGQL